MKKEITKEIKTVLKVAKKEYLFEIFTSLMIRGILLIIPVLFSYSINEITNNNILNACVLIVISILITGIYRFFEGLHQYSYHGLYNKLFSYYNALAIEKTNDNSLFSLSRFSLGQYTNTVISDVDIIAGYFTASVMRITQVLEFLVIYIYFFFLDKYIFILAIILSIIMFFVMLKSGNKIQKLNEKRKSELDKLSSSTYEYFLGIKEIKSFNIYNLIAPITVNKTIDYLNANKNYCVKFNCNNQLYVYIFEVFRLLTMLYGIYLITIGNIEVGVILVIYNYYQKIIDNFAMILTINVETRNLNVSLNRFNKLIEYSQKTIHNKDVEITSVNGKLEFSNILYGYRTNPMLDNVSFSINANSITVLCGKSLNGKEGIFDLLLKLNRQHEGIITLDDVNINDYDNETYFSHVSFARKEPIFFNMSIRDNLQIVNKDFKEIVSICQYIGVHDDILLLKNGYDTIINEAANIPLSVKQLLSIARLFIKNSRIILLDEIINGVDKKSYDRILKLLKKFKKNHTIIISSQDKSVFEIADEIIVLEENKIVEKGTLSSLLRKKGKFYTNYQQLLEIKNK